MKSFLSRFIKHQRGVALIEFAFVFPFMFLLLFGCIELGRYIMIIQRLEHASYVVTDIVGQYPPATGASASGEISVGRMTIDVYPQLHRIMGMYGDTANETIAISSVIRQNGNRTALRWQARTPVLVSDATSIVTGTAPTNTARVGGVCANAPFNAEVNAQLGTMMRDENMIVGEVYYRYRPIIASLLPVTTATQNMPGGGGGPFSVAERTLVRRVFLHPRNGDLLDLPPAHPVTAGACP